MMNQGTSTSEVTMDDIRKEPFHVRGGPTFDRSADENKVHLTEVGH